MAWGGVAGGEGAVGEERVVHGVQVLRGEVPAVAAVVVDGDEEAVADAEGDRGDDRGVGDAVGADPDVRVAVGRRADAGVAVAVPGVVDLQTRRAVGGPELAGHGVGRVAGAGAAVGQVRAEGILGARHCSPGTRPEPKSPKLSMLPFTPMYLQMTPPDSCVG